MPRVGKHAQVSQSACRCLMWRQMFIGASRGDTEESRWSAGLPTATAHPAKAGDAKPRAYGSDTPRAAGPPNGEAMRCTHCDRSPIQVDMTVREGRQLTLRS